MNTKLVDIYFLRIVYKIYTLLWFDSINPTKFSLKIFIERNTKYDNLLHLKTVVFN